MVGLLVAAAVLALATIVGVVLRARSGRLRRSDRVALPAGLPAVTPGAVTLLQFSSATCAPCRQVRAVCTALAGELPGVHHVELDAEAHLDAVRQLEIWRLPTLLVVDGAGRVTRRAVGVPDRAQLALAVAAAQEAQHA